MSNVIPFRRPMSKPPFDPASTDQLLARMRRVSEATDATLFDAARLLEHLARQAHARTLAVSGFREVSSAILARTGILSAR